MKQTTLSQNGGPLLNYASSRLSPDVFSHPVWMRFARQDASVSANIANDLLHRVKGLQESDPGLACQILLICAVYQNYAGQAYNALKTNRQALALAERTGLSREIVWAMWGACAISIQQRNYEQAGNSLVDLQAALSQQNEWILADFIDVVRESLLQPVAVGSGKPSGLLGNQQFEDILSVTFHWIQHWGFSIDTFKPEADGTLNPSKSHASTTAHGKTPFSTSEKVNGNHLAKQATTVIPVAVHMLGTFSMMIGELVVKLPTSRGLALLKYLLLHHKQNTPREVLMEIFWPDAAPETARNNLNVAMHALRKAIFTVTDLPMIIYEGGAYSLAPDIKVWLDVEEFERCIKAGQRLETGNQLTVAIAEYEAAISLYQGDFLEQNPYEEWAVLERERLHVAYLDTLDRLGQIYFSQERFAACITVCQHILMSDRCREDAHCLLMRCYSRQGQYHLALRQYQSCVEALRAELEVESALETTELYEQIRRRERV